MIRSTIVMAIGLALVAVLSAAPALAQRDRVFVASYGSNSNPCTFGSPCKTFQNAVNVVATGGEVTAIDSAGFGPINITKAVTITSPAGVEAGIVPAGSGDDAITINTTGDVQLRGLTIEGGDSGRDGIAIATSATSPDTLAIIDCVIRHFTHDGIYLQPAGFMQLSILNTIASNNGNDGIDLSPVGIVDDGGQIYGVIDHATVTSNRSQGISIFGGNTQAELGTSITIVNSLAANNGNNGVYVFGNTGAFMIVMVLDSTASNNTNNGYFADGSQSQMTFAHSAATANAIGIKINSQAIGESFGDNHIYGNGPPDVMGQLPIVGFH